MKDYTFKRFLRETIFNKDFYVRLFGWIADLCSVAFEKFMDKIATIIDSYYFRSVFEIGLWSFIGIAISFYLRRFSPIVAVLVLCLSFIFGILRYFYWMWCDIQRDKYPKKRGKRSNH